MAAPAISHPDKDQILAATPLASLIGRTVALKRVGRLQKACCPFHAEKSPSFTVYDHHYHCFGCGAHGDAVTFLERSQGLSFGEALQQLAAEAGITDRSSETRSQRQRRERLERDRARQQAARAAKEARDREQYLGWVGKRVSQTKPVAGTLAERYLVEARGIPKPLSGWPDSVRYDPRERAVVFVATDPGGGVRGGQWVYLADDATKAAPTDDRPSKRSRGEVRGSAVRLPGRAEGPLQVAEGPETGLSVWVASGCETQVALGGIGGLPTPPAGREVVACLDDDKRHSAAARRARDTVARWRRSGLRVAISKPWEVRREDNSDFNDLLREAGSGAVEARIIEALQPLFYASGLRPSAAAAAPPTPEPKDCDYAVAGIERRGRERQPVAKPPLWDDHGSDVRVPDTVPIPVEIGRIRLKRLADAEAARVLAASDSPGHTNVIGAGAGLGKTAEFLSAAVGVIRELRARGDQRNVVVGVPRLDLADEIAGRLRAPDLRIEVWRGGDALNPETGHRMCRNGEARRAAEMRRLDPRKVVCPGCPFFAGCAKLAQDHKTADIWIVAHNLVFERKPKALGKLAWLIIDENPIGAALIGTGDPCSTDGNKPVILDEEALRQPTLIDGDPERTDLLHHVRGLQNVVLETAPNGRLTRAAVLDAGLTVEVLQAAMKLEYDTVIEPEITTGMPLAERIAALHEVDGNIGVGKRIMLHRAMLALLYTPRRTESGHVDIVTFRERHGDVRAFSMKGVRAIRPAWQVATTVLDATCQPGLLRHIWPNISTHKVAQLAAPHRHIRQVHDRAFSLAMLDPNSPFSTAKDRARREAALDGVRLTIAREVRRYAPGRVLVVAQKAIRIELEARGGFGDNAIFAHHGAVTGRDEWKDVRAVIVVGRQMPPPAAVQRMAEALTGVPVAEAIPAGRWYARRDATHLLAGGDLIASETDFHPDEIAEAFRWRSCEGELVQIIERARGVNRASDAQRVDILLMTDVPLPMPIDELLTSPEVSPRVEDQMLATGGVAFQNAASAAVAYPGAFPSGPNLRVQRWREKERLGDWWTPHPWLTKWRFRKQANGARHEFAYIDPARIEDPVAHLTDTLGPMDYCQQVAPLPPEEPKLSKADETQRVAKPGVSVLETTDGPVIWAIGGVTAARPRLVAPDG